MLRSEIEEEAADSFGEVFVGVGVMVQIRDSTFHEG